jgi:hypothetical protein
MYQCRKTFTSKNGRHFQYGEEITDTHYRMLQINETTNFKYCGIGGFFKSSIIKDDNSDSINLFSSIKSSDSGDDDSG